MPRTILCLKQEENDIAFKFSSTGIEVYTFEEALFHAYKYWKESERDLFSGEFALWVQDVLDLKPLAAKISELAKIESAGERILAFLNITDFLSSDDVFRLKSEITIWESQLEWERHLIFADELMSKQEYKKALYNYKKALEGGRSLKLLSNMGVCLMHLGFYYEACLSLSTAYETDKSNIAVLLNYSEALILAGEYEEAFKYLKKAEREGEMPEVNYLYGLLASLSGNHAEAVNHYERAAKEQYDPIYYYALAKAYVSQRKFSKALDALENIKVKDKDFYKNQAAVFEGLGDNAAAIKSAEKALLYSGRNNTSEIWALISRYRRKNFEPDKAERASSMAVYANKDSKLALIEMAMLKKAQGNYKDYQKNLNDILNILKDEYRDRLDVELAFTKIL